MRGSRRFNPSARFGEQRVFSPGLRGTRCRFPKGFEMPDADGAFPASDGFVAAPVESTTAGKPGRIRLSKALAATAKAMAKKAGTARQTKRVSRRCKLADNENAQLGVLKLRLQILGMDMKKGDLLRAGLLLLADCDDVQLRKAVARLDANAAPPGLQAAP